MNIKNHLGRNRIVTVSRTLLSTGWFLAVLTAGPSLSQTPSPSPNSGDDRYRVTASTEIGARWIDGTGNEEKFRSDLNYRKGFRLFDSSVLIEDTSEGGSFKPFDSMLFVASGWGADPSGHVRFNMERQSKYRLDASVRRVAFFNDLNNHAIGASLINYHNADTRRNFGDIDFTILPDNRNIRFRLGYSFNFLSGTGLTTSRISDAIPVAYNASGRTQDLRAGVDGRLLGFSVSATYGRRLNSDRTGYRLLAPDPGDQTTNTAFAFTMERHNPVFSTTDYGVFSFNRTFAERFDVTGKVLYSSTSMHYRWFESVFYRDTSNRITTDIYNIVGDAKRPQFRGDLGMTWRITDKFRVSNTYTFDRFSINGGNLYALDTIRTTTSPTRNFNYLVTDYDRHVNTIEADYQFSDRFGVNAGYRFTRREVTLMWTGLNTLTNAHLTGSPANETAENTTNTFLAGAKVKPTSNWSVYADVESGKADNVFTRVANYKFTNYRIRSRADFGDFALNASYISKDNENPGRGPSGLPETFLTETRSRLLSTSVDWQPTSAFSFAAGYDYHHLTSEAFIRVPISGVRVDGLSQYFVRDNYFFVDASVRAHKRVSFFGSYRWNKDRGHGDRALPPLNSPIIIGSYPIDFKTPEIKAAIRLNKYLDWNVGYQYYDYSEAPPQSIIYGLPFHDYKTHMPYMSVRIYLGKVSADR